MMYLNKDFNFKDILFLSLLYFLFWISEIYNFPIILKSIIVLVSILYQFLSFKRSVAILFLALFIPFINKFIGSGIFSLDKLFSVIFILKFLTRNNVRTKFNGNIILVIFLFIFLLRIIHSIFLVYYPFYYGTEFTAINFVAEYYSFFVLVLIFQSFYKKDTLENGFYFFLQLILLYSTFMALSIIQQVIINPHELYLSTRTGLLWNNEFFNHKNTWGLHFSLLSIFCIYILNNPNYIKVSKKIIFFILCISILILAFSLSRRAAIIFLGAILFLFRAKIKLSNFFFFSFIAFIVLIIKPDFLYNRFSSLFNATTMIQFSNASSGQLSSTAINQFLDRFTFIPQMTYLDWEYNFMEGFYNELLYRLGILGLIFYLFLIYNIRKISNNRLLRLFFYIILLGGFGYRELFICDIYGKVSYVNFLIGLIIFSHILIVKNEKEKNIIHH